MNEPQLENPPEQKSPDAKVKGVLNGLQKNYILVGNPHIKTWHGLLVLGVAVGLVAGVFLIANRDGRMEPVVETLPLPSIVIPPAENSAGVTNWRIAYPFHDSQGKQQIFTIRLDGTEKRQLTFLGDNGLPSWMPDGKRMVFTSVRTNSTTKRDEIGAWIMNADGSNQRQILPNVIAADISPDGTKLTYVNAAASPAWIWPSDIDGTNPRQLTFPEEGISMIHPTWSHDGTRIAYMRFVQDPSYQPSGFIPDIWVMNADGSNQHLLTTTNPNNIDVNGKIINTAHDANAPDWSPVGDKIAVWSGVETSNGQIWVVDANDGSKRTQLTEAPLPSRNDDPAWSPDGKMLSFSSDRDGRIGLWVMNADGSNERFLTEVKPGVTPGDAAWQPTQ